jgi:hypothetical protein
LPHEFPETRLTPLARIPLLAHLAAVRPTVTLLLLLLLAAPIRSADWKVQHLNSGDPIREDAPIPMRLAIVNPTNRPIEGRIDSVVKVGSKTVAHHLSQPVVLSPGPQTIPLLLPPAPGEAGLDRTATLNFVTPDSSILLGSFLLPFEDGLRFVTAHVKGDTIHDADFTFAQQFQFNVVPGATPIQPPGARNRVTFLEVTATQQQNQRILFGPSTPKKNIAFRPLWIAPSDLPTHPLALCAYDCLVLHPSALEEMRARQFEALAQWVDSGGRLLIFAASHPKSAPIANVDSVRAFLRRLSLDWPELTWDLSPSRKFLDLQNGERLFSAGCGRVAVFSDFESFTEDARLAAMKSLVGDVGGARMTNTPAAWPTGTELQTALTTRLLPDAPRPIAVSTIVSAMLGFIALATVADYFFLGWLRRRKYTWLLFPSLAAAATSIMLAVANRHMNALEQRGSLRVVDLGYDGRILREHRVTAILPTHAKAESFETRSALAAELVFAGWEAYNVWNRPNSRSAIANYQLNPQKDLIEHLPANVEGSIPSTSRLHLALQQWTPKFIHSYIPGGGADDSQIHWAQWQPTSRPNPEADEPMVVVSGSRVTSKRRSISPEQRTALDPSNRYTFLSFDPVAVAPGAGYVAPGRLEDVIYRCSPHRLLFSLPPAGEFLPHLASDPRETILFAFRQDGPNITCYRKLYRITPEESAP